MRDALRLVMFAVIIFGVTTLSVLFSDPGFAANLTERLGFSEGGEAAPIQLAQADSPPAGAPPAQGQAAAPAAAAQAEAAPAATGRQQAAPARLTAGEAVVRIPRAQPGIWMGLAGFPAHATLRFPLPEGVNIVEGQVQLDLQSELVEQGDGLLTVLVNGTERDAIVLMRGTTTLQLTYPLLPADLAAGEILVTLDANGTTNWGQICPTNAANLGAAIAVLESSGLALQLDAPRSDVETRIALASEPIGLWAPDQPAMQAWATQWLSRQGVPAQARPLDQNGSFSLVAEAAEPLSMNDAGQITLAGTEALDMVARIKGATLPASYEAQWPLPINALTPDLAAHTFRGSSRWLLDYKLADLPDGLAPARLHLALKTSQLVEPNQWSLRVLLNGNLVHAANHPGTDGAITLDVPLPAQFQFLSNQLAIVLVDNSPNQGICRAGPEAAAQLLPESYLDPVQTPEGAKQVLVSALAGSGGVFVAGPASADQGATLQTQRLLDLILPLDVPASFLEEKPVSIQMLDEPALQALRDNDASQGFLVVAHEGQDPDGVAVWPLDEWRDRGTADPVQPGALFVSW
ncbi:cellulose biosynthesis cyclic di-GMP-binding regulatory protein BcsB [Devosia sp. 1566]|uniref:cellulose biosynthesis cyclic di-GMP-binding regulatory protein BcsB n=1 Tax=Devosia sp. 1566 TaxID=2499144 RepID=UPI000FD7287E|nr:cellulose biosynthesis cyclic di-GMP-binding regulatory protein BcsB [Devosia sp. 1566]